MKMLSRTRITWLGRIVHGGLGTNPPPAPGASSSLMLSTSAKFEQAINSDGRTNAVTVRYGSDTLTMTAPASRNSCSCSCARPDIRTLTSIRPSLSRRRLPGPCSGMPNTRACSAGLAALSAGDCASISKRAESLPVDLARAGSAGVVCIEAGVETAAQLVSKRTSAAFASNPNRISHTLQATQSKDFAAYIVRAPSSETGLYMVGPYLVGVGVALKSESSPMIGVLPFGTIMTLILSPSFSIILSCTSSAVNDLATVRL